MAGNNTVLHKTRGLNREKKRNLPNIIKFCDCSKCQNCDLYLSAKHPGLPTREFAPSTNKEKALLVVGQSPGWEEDKRGKSWVGWSGNILTDFINACHFTDFADVFLSNACRCLPPPKKTPTQGEVKACRPNLEYDINQLGQYYSEIILLGLGASAALSLSGFSTLQEAFRHQNTYPVALRL